MPWACTGMATSLAILAKFVSRDEGFLFAVQDDHKLHAATNRVPNATRLLVILANAHLCCA